MTLLTRTNGGLRTRSLFPRTLADDFFAPALDLFEGERLGYDWMPAANVREDEKNYTVELSVPGYTRNEIKVEVTDDNVLRISGEHKEESKEENENYTRREFSYGNFLRSFELPKSVTEEKIAAKVTDGVLRVVLPKSEMTISKKKTKEIKIA